MPRWFNLYVTVGPKQTGRGGAVTSAGKGCWRIGSSPCATLTLVLSTSLRDSYARTFLDFRSFQLAIWGGGGGGSENQTCLFSKTGSFLGMSCWIGFHRNPKAIKIWKPKLIFSGSLASTSTCSQSCLALIFDQRFAGIYFCDGQKVLFYGRLRWREKLTDQKWDSSFHGLADLQLWVHCFKRDGWNRKGYMYFQMLNINSGIHCENSHKVWTVHFCKDFCPHDIQTDIRFGRDKWTDIIWLHASFMLSRKRDEVSSSSHFYFWLQKFFHNLKTWWTVGSW